MKDDSLKENVYIKLLRFELDNIFVCVRFFSMYCFDTEQLNEYTDKTMSINNMTDSCLFVYLYHVFQFWHIYLQFIGELYAFMCVSHSFTVHIYKWNGFQIVIIFICL